MELEEVKKKMNQKEFDFFYKFRENLDEQLYFIGSITRNDFIKGKSDFDVDVFAENMVSTKYKIEHLLNYHYKNKEPTYIVFKINGVPISGYKYNFKNKDIFFDLTIYSIKCKELLLQQRKIDSNIPFFLGIFLRIIKYLHYYLKIINNTQYSILKKKIWFFNNSQKTTSTTYNKEKYIEYIQNENLDKRYLVNYLI